MKTIKCKKCGREMSAMSEACPMCGYRNDKPIKGLHELFTDCVCKQKTQPFNQWHIGIAVNDSFNEAENWFFFSSEFFTNQPRLGIGFIFTEEQETEFLGTEIATEFIKEEDSDRAYSLDCGSDVDKATQIVTYVVRAIFQVENEIPFQLIGTPLNIKSYLNAQKCMEFHFDDLPFDSGIFEKIHKVANHYNDYAEKYGYERCHVAFDLTNRSINGSYFAKNEAEGNYFKQLKAAGRNGELSADIIRIISSCFKLYQ